MAGNSGRCTPQGLSGNEKGVVSGPHEPVYHYQYCMQDAKQGRLSLRYTSANTAFETRRDEAEKQVLPVERKLLPEQNRENGPELTFIESIK